MADDLNTQLVFGANTAGAEAGVRTVKRSLKDLADSAAAAGKSIEGAGDKAGQSLSGIADGGEAAARKIQRDTASMKSSLQRYLSTLEGGSKDSRKYWESMADFKGVDKNALRPLLDQLDAYKSKTVAASESTVTWSSNLTKIGAGVAGIAAVTASAGVAAKAMFDASASAERLRTMLDFSTGGNSAKEIEFLRGVTYRLGLEFTSTARAYGQFQAAAKGTALEGDKARGVFESVAKASAVMGLSAADTSGVLLALQQMISKGTVQAEELRGQLGERLPGAFQVAAKAMGVTTAELGKMLEQGQVVADDFLPKFGRALEENLGGAAEKAAQRLDAAVNRFDTAWEKLKQRAGDSGVSKAVAGELGAITRDLEAVTDGMDRAGRAGGGMWAQFGAAGAIAAGRVGFSTLNLAANSLNGAINALTGGVFGLRTDLALLPDVFKTDAQYAKALADRLAEAETKMAALQGTGASTTSNPYIRDSYFQLQEYIKELKKAQAEQAKLTGVPVVGVNEGIVAQGRAREAYNTQRAKDEEAAAAFRLNLAGVPSSYVKEMQELIRLNQAGIIVGKEYTDALKKQQDELLKKTGAVKSSNAAANQEQNAYESLIASIRAKIEADNLEIAGGAALTESQRIRIKLDQDLAAGRVKLTAQNERAVRLALEELAASEASALAAKTLAKANLDAAASREKYLTSLSTGLDKIKADTAAQLEATARMGLSKEAIAELDAAKLEMLATDLELQAIKAMDRNLDQQTYDALKLQAEAYRDLAAAKRDGGAKEAALEMEKANKDAAKKAADEWQRAADDINRSLTDALLRGFESGKGFAENLRDVLKNMFSTLILRPIISAVMSPVAGAMNSMVGGAMNSMGIGQVAGQVGQNMLGNVGSSLISSGLGSTIAGGIGSAVGSIFGVGAGNVALGTSLGLGIGSSTAAASAAAAAGGAGVGAAGATAMGGALSSAAMAIPYIGAIIAIASILSGMDDSGTYHTGGAAQYSAANGLLSGQSGADFGIGFGRVEAGQQTIGAVGTLAQALGTALDGIAVSFGQSAGYEIATAFADDTSEDGAWGALRISKDGKDLLNWDDSRMSKWAPKDFADGEEGYKQYLAAIAKDTRQVLLDMDLPSWADDMLEAIGESASMDSLNAAIAQIGVVQTAFVGMSRNLVGFADYSEEARGALMELSGGIEALASNASTYYSNFYSASEQRANLEKQLNEEFAKLNLTLPDVDATDARAQYRALIEAQDSSTEEGRKAIAMLLQLAGVFAQITVSGDEVAAQIANQRQSLEERLLKAQGKDRELLDLQRKREYDALAKLDPALAALITQIYELEDAAQAAADAEAARVAAIDKAYRNLEAAYAREQKVLEGQLDGLEQYRSFVEKQQALQQESLSLITGVFDVLHSSVIDLYGSVSSTAAMQAEQGRAFIAQALTTAVTTGYLPEQDQLSEAIRAAVAGVNSGTYANTTEQDFAKLVLAGQLRALEEVAGKQKTDAEKQLDALQKQLDSIDDQTDAINKQLKLQQESLDYWQEQIDIANGVYDATMSVEQAIRDLARGLGIEDQVNTKAPIVEGGKKPVFGGGGGSGGGAAQDPAKYYRLIYGGTAGTGREAIRDQSMIERLDRLSPIYHSFDGTGDLPGLAAAMKAAGGTIADLSILSGNWESDWRNAFAGVGIPAFAVGTNYVPRDMLAQIHEGEAIVPKAFNPWANGGAASGSDNTALIAELRALRAEVAELRVAAESTAAATGDTADVLVRVTQNGNGMLTAAAPI